MDKRTMRLYLYRAKQVNGEWKMYKTKYDVVEKEDCYKYRIDFCNHLIILKGQDGLVEETRDGGEYFMWMSSGDDELAYDKFLSHLLHIGEDLMEQSEKALEVANRFKEDVRNAEEEES